MSAPAAPPTVFVIPGDPDSRTGGYLYDKRVMAGLRDLGHAVALCRLDGDYPLPADDELAAAEVRLDGIPDGARVVVDGLAFAGLAPLLPRLARRCTLVALIHHPLAAETGLTPDRRQRLFAAEAAALRQAARVVVPSPTTRDDLRRDYAVPGARIGEVPPGTDPAPLAAGARATTTPRRLLTVGTVTPRKGHAELVEALAALRRLPWRLTCVGSLRRDPACAARLRARIRAFGLAGRVTLRDEVDGATLSRLYGGADLYLQPSHLEGYGMAIAEALARGLPVLSGRQAAIVDTLPSGSLALAPAVTPAALTATLYPLLCDRAAAQRLRAAARRARRMLPTWPQAAAAFAGELAEASR